MEDHYDEDMSSLQSPTSLRSPVTPQQARRSVLIPTNSVTTKDGQTVGYFCHIACIVHLLRQVRARIDPSLVSNKDALAPRKRLTAHLSLDGTGCRQTTLFESQDTGTSRSVRPTRRFG